MILRLLSSTGIQTHTKQSSSWVAYSACADCELMTLSCLQNFLFWTYWPIDSQSGRVDQDKMLSLHLVFGFPLLLLPSTMPSKQILDTPVVDLLMWPYSFRVLHLILSKEGEGSFTAEGGYPSSIYQSMSSDEAHNVILEHLNALGKLLGPCDAIKTM